MDAWVARGAAHANKHLFDKAIVDFQTALGKAAPQSVDIVSDSSQTGPKHADRMRPLCWRVCRLCMLLQGCQSQ